MPRSPEGGPGAGIADLLRSRGIADPAVLSAIARLDRRRFLPPEHRPMAVLDIAVPIGLAQTISQPYIVGVMTMELSLSGSERVLEIGTGSGYQTAVLARLAKTVYTIERHAVLSLRARGLLDGLRVENVHYRVGDGSLGWPDEAPFDRILVAASAPQVPPALFRQLAEGGRLIAPIGTEEEQYLTLVRKEEGRELTRKVLACRFVRLIGEGGWASDRGP